MKHRGRRLHVMAGGLLLGLVVSSAGQTHAFVEGREAYAGYSTDIDLRISHGCKGSPTTSVRVKIPEGITNVYPQHSNRWKISTKKRKLDKPIEMEQGVVISEVIDEITWSGSTLPDDQFDSFVFRVKMPDEPGRLVYFKTIQTCTVGEHRWVEVPTKPVKWLDYVKATPEPAPFVKLLKADRPQLDLSMTIKP